VTLPELLAPIMSFSQVELSHLWWKSIQCK